MEGELVARRLQNSSAPRPRNPMEPSVTALTGSSYKPFIDSSTILFVTRLQQLGDVLAELALPPPASPTSPLSQAPRTVSTCRSLFSSSLLISPVSSRTITAHHIHHSSDLRADERQGHGSLGSCWTGQLGAESESCPSLAEDIQFHVAIFRLEESRDRPRKLLRMPLRTRTRTGKQGSRQGHVRQGRDGAGAGGGGGGGGGGPLEILVESSCCRPVPPRKQPQGAPAEASRLAQEVVELSSDLLLDVEVGDLAADVPRVDRKDDHEQHEEGRAGRQTRETDMQREGGDVTGGLASAKGSDGDASRKNWRRENRRSGKVHQLAALLLG
eukprot:768523-Hanusia_phi.AAC.2